jgi:hypothetical protein
MSNELLDKLHGYVTGRYQRDKDDDNVQQIRSRLHPMTTFDATEQVTNRTSYSQKLEQELHQLRAAYRSGLLLASQKQLQEGRSKQSTGDALTVATSEIPSHVHTLKCLSRIIAKEQLSTSIDSHKNTLDLLRTGETSLREAMANEKHLHDELSTLNSLLEARIKTMTQQTARPPDIIINTLQNKENIADARNRELIGELRSLLDDHVADQLYAGEGDGNDHESLKTDLRTTVESLMNEMFVPSPTSGGYVRVEDPDGTIVRFLLQADLITVKYNDPTQIRLRDFGKPANVESF